MRTEEKITRSFDIVGGPCKDTLFDACKYAGNKDMRIAVDFKIAYGHTGGGSLVIYLPVSDIVILGIENEDGSGESFNLKGSLTANLDIDKVYSSGVPTTRYSFKAYFSSKTRKGHITLTR